MYLVISCSPNFDSRSKRLAQRLINLLTADGRSVESIDLSTIRLPQDTGRPNRRPEVATLSAKISNSHAVVLVSPVYRGNIAVSTSNLVQLCGDAFQRKVMLVVSVSGDPLANHTTLNLANQLMLERQAFVLPDFVFVDSKDLSASSDSQQGAGVDDRTAAELQKAVIQLTRVTSALAAA